MDSKQFRLKVGRRIKQLRTEAGLSQEDMDQGKYGISYRTIQDVENLDTDIRLSTIFRIAKRLKIKPKDILDI